MQVALRRSTVCRAIYNACWYGIFTCLEPTEVLLFGCTITGIAQREREVAHIYLVMPFELTAAATSRYIHATRDGAVARATKKTQANHAASVLEKPEGLGNVSWSVLGEASFVRQLLPVRPSRLPVQDIRTSSPRRLS